MKVPLLDLKAQHQTIRAEALAAVTAVLDSQVCIGGPVIGELEQKIAAYTGARFAVAVSSGTDALLCSLMSLDIGPGDEVITTPFTFFATAGCIARLGAKPVFVDIDPRTYNLDTAKIEAAVTPRTRAIMPVHLFGQCCDMDPILQIAVRRRLAVIEDGAQAIGATYKGRQAGTMGTVGCFSFFPSKNLGAAGDGGMIVTNDEALAERLRIMRSHGSKPKYFHKFVGGNFRLDAIQAAILLVKLPHLNAWSEARRRNAADYNQRFADADLTTPYIAPGCVSIYNQYVVRTPHRDAVVAQLKAAEVGTEIYYPRALHEQECFADLGHRRGDFPVSERAAGEVLALPVYPELSPEQREFVASAVLRAVAVPSTTTVG